jgi:hypothetical protein
MHDLQRSDNAKTAAVLVGETDTQYGPGAPALLGVSRAVFRAWVAAGLLHPVELPDGIRRRLYRVSDLERFAASLGERR